MLFKKVKYIRIIAFGVLALICVLGYQSFALDNSKNVFAKNEDSSIVLCTWNIAHYYAYGSAKNVIDGAIYEEKLKAFRAVLYDSINADIITLNEYSSNFGVDKMRVAHKSAAVLFDKYETKYEGGTTRKGIVHNAMYSNVRVREFKNQPFEFIKTTKYKKSHRGFCYLASNVYIDGKKVKLVCVHLIYSKKDPSLVQGQISELIEAFKGEERVVICGDFNTSNYSKFKKAGYTLANDGSIVTFYKTSKPLDNIITKGVRISEVRTVKTELSDHYPLVCRLSID